MSPRTLSGLPDIPILVANDDAPLGQIPFLQFEGLGTVEDKAIFRSSAFVYLEIIEKEEPKESDKEAK